jgi:hypothetical protein
VGPDTEHLPGSVTATLHSVDEGKDVAGFEQVEIDCAWDPSERNTGSISAAFVFSSPRRV